MVRTLHIKPFYIKSSLYRKNETIHPISESTPFHKEVFVGINNIE